ncbi:MAG: hypothetical protein LQ338_007722, partial [Usnochroma carphineum]
AEKEKGTRKMDRTRESSAFGDAKYLLGTCTLTIAFLLDLDPWPGKPHPPYPERYTTSYASMYMYAKALFEECIWKQRTLGWLAPRTRLREYPVGVFYWQTGSVQDGDVPGTNGILTGTA